MAHVKIEVHGAHTKVFLDGTDITGSIKSYRLEHNARELPVLHMESSITELTFEGDVLPILPEPWRDFYVRKNKLSTEEYSRQEQLLADIRERNKAQNQQCDS